MPRTLPRRIPQVTIGQQSQSWLLPVLVAVLMGGGGSQLPLDAWIRLSTLIALVVVVLVIAARASLTRVVEA
ncbi:hypothetical protein [Streptomyces katrae]|uniref:Uncharacterized protein n=1 Tax=Streptomyces katrae TaxID=68223 RepID=A0A0F4IW61_9ACTN|nr:hypothetical protein [Streptomyces katrae]KJY26252.1 hypothetical protein VR44_30565 [Streptomyces katrae]